MKVPRWCVAITLLIIPVLALLLATTNLRGSRGSGRLTVTAFAPVESPAGTVQFAVWNPDMLTKVNELDVADVRELFFDGLSKTAPITNGCFEVRLNLSFSERSSVFSTKTRRFVHDPGLVGLVGTNLFTIDFREPPYSIEQVETSHEWFPWW